MKGSVIAVAVKLFFTRTAISTVSPGGTGIRPFQPLVIALASGANFVGRGFSADPNRTTELLVEAIRHPGFSFVEVLSPCVTFRPEQRDWSDMVHPAQVEPTDDPSRAARRIMTDDGFNLGILYRGDRPAYQPDLGPIVRLAARERSRSRQFFERSTRRFS